ncbi:hypothetical protein GW587_30660 [Duganella sp. SAP-35]|uniref:Uncharacterized protein n=1 Tax=Duganella aceris TaxID=2703883 RepID=A0ABX0FV62_9BURK|nr:hypothetical protein [Duganella aceris]
MTTKKAKSLMPYEIGQLSFMAGNSKIDSGSDRRLTPQLGPSHLFLDLPPPKSGNCCRYSPYAAKNSYFPMSYSGLNLSWKNGASIVTSHGVAALQIIISSPAELDILMPLSA